MKSLAGKFIIVYDLKHDNGTRDKQALFFGHDNGVPCVLHDDAKLFDTYTDAVRSLPLALRVGQIDPDNLEAPYVVEIPNE